MQMEDVISSDSSEVQDVDLLVGMEPQDVDLFDTLKVRDIELLKRLEEQDIDLLGFWREMLTYSTPGVIKIEPRPNDPSLEGGTRLENNNFDHYRQLTDLDDKQHGLENPQEMNGRSTFLRYHGEASHDFDPYSSRIYDGGGGGYSGEMQSQTGLSGGEMSPSSSPPPMPRTYKPCVVCNDKSSGYHYGVSSCEGCKGFFRRSVQKNMQYTCHKEKNCVINKVTRNRCQYCRLQKCYANGMSKEAVRNDRNKKRKTRHEGCVSSASAEEMTSEEESIIQRLLKAHEETYPIMVNDDRFKLKTIEDVEKSSTILWEQVSELSTSGIIRIVEFGKRVPGFTSLSTTDQITLLKAACLEVMMLRLGSRFEEETETIKFSNGLSLSEKQLEVGGFGTLTKTIFKFAKSLAQMNVDETEFALLAAISLMSGDRSGLEEPEKVEALQEPILEALKHYMRRRRTSQPHSFAKMLMKLTDLRSISVKGAERVLHLRREMPGELPPLILEMLDRAENVCIP